MALHVINQYQPNQGITFRYSLPDSMKSLFAKHFILNKSLSADEYRELLTTCQTIHKQQCWVQCDCIGQGEKPLFRFNLSVNGKLYLYRLTDRAAHHHYCIFKEQERQSPTKKTNTRVYRPFVELDGALDLLGMRAEGISNSKTQSRASSKSACFSRPTHKLAKALYHLLDKGGFNHFNPHSNVKLKQAMKQATNAIELTQGIRLTDYFTSNAKGLVLLANNLRQAANWPSRIPKQALMFVKVKSFSHNKLEAIHYRYPGDDSPETVEIDIHNRIYQWSGRYSERTAPYMALILVTDLPEKPGYFVAFNAFLMPCHKPITNMPVDSDYERSVLKALYRLAYQYKETPVALEIIKPVKDIPVIIGEDTRHVLPDFILQYGDKRVIIEVNGSHESEYLERKKRTHADMEQLANVLVIDAYGQDKANTLHKAIKKLINQIKEELSC